VTFQTANVPDSENTGDITIEGFGSVPLACREGQTSTCTLHICSGSLNISSADDASWAFSVIYDDDPIPPNDKKVEEYSTLHAGDSLLFGQSVTCRDSS
jgi:hypothetical protein